MPLLFLAIGIAVFKLLGVTIADFMVARRHTAFCDFHKRFNHYRKDPERVDLVSLGAVPLGVPLITGPAVLTTSILLLNEHSFLITAMAILVNILIEGIVFFFSQYIIKFLGKAGAKTVSKIASLLLAAIGVMIVRKGIEYFISSWI